MKVSISWTINFYFHCNYSGELEGEQEDRAV